MIFFSIHALYDFDVLVENGTKETGYGVANSKIDARKMVLEYFFLITPVTLHTKHLKAVFFAVFFFLSNSSIFYNETVGTRTA